METFSSATISRGRRKKQAKADLFSTNRNIYQTTREIYVCGVTLEMYMFGPSLLTTGKTNGGHTHLMGGGDCALIINM